MITFILNNSEVAEINTTEKEITIGSNFDGYINGFNLNFVYPKYLVEITDVQGPDDNFHYDLNPEKGVLKVLWIDESKNQGKTVTGNKLFTVTVKQAGESSETDILFNLLDGGMVLNSRNDNQDYSLCFLVNNKIHCGSKQNWYNREYGNLVVT